MMAGKNASAFGGWAKSRFAGLALVLALAFGSHTAFAEGKIHHRVTRPVAASHLASFRHRREYASHFTHTHHYAYAGHRSGMRLVRYYGYRHGLHYRTAHYSYSRLQCVPYAREVSHIQLSGDAFLWWAEAAGRYARGSAPVEGAVLNFRSIRRMPLGHVAVVTSVIDSRTILVTQANWIRGSITNDVTMQDVSANNDWSQVEVELGDSSRWGAAYPTYGFIYNQPDNGGLPGSSSTVIASAAQGDEVAEAPKPQPIQTESLNRNLQ